MGLSCVVAVGLGRQARGEVRWGWRVAEGVRIRVELRMRSGSSAMDTSAGVLLGLGGTRRAQARRDGSGGR